MDLMTLPQIADELGVSVNTVRHWQKYGSTTIRFGRIGRRVMARRSDVEAWVDKQLG